MTKHTAFLINACTNKCINLALYGRNNTRYTISWFSCIPVNFCGVFCFSWVTSRCRNWRRRACRCLTRCSLACRPTGKDAMLRLLSRSPPSTGALRQKSCPNRTTSGRRPPRISSSATRSATDQYIAPSASYPKGISFTLSLSATHYKSRAEVWHIGSTFYFFIINTHAGATPLSKLTSNV